MLPCWIYSYIHFSSNQLFYHPPHGSWRRTMFIYSDVTKLTLWFLKMMIVTSISDGYHFFHHLSYGWRGRCLPLFLIETTSFTAHLMGLLPDTYTCGFCMRRECRERIPHHRGLAIPTCITARASRTCRDACWDRLLAVSLDIGGGDNVPGIPSACATRNFTYVVRGPWCSKRKMASTNSLKRPSLPPPIV